MQPDFLGNVIENILKTFWPFLAFIIVVWVIREIGPVIIGAWNRKRKFSIGEKYRSGRSLIKWLQDLSPKEFEQYIAHMFENLGFIVEVTGSAYDGGIDVVAEKNGVKHYIQCKKFITQQVPVSAVRDFYGAMADKGAQAKGFFITTNKFTLEAEKFAESKPIELIDGFKLADLLEKAKMDSFAIPGKAETILCPICKSPMVKRNGKFGEFYGCSKFPECKGTRKI